MILVDAVFVLDQYGVVARYKLPYNGNLRDGAYPAVDRLSLIWERPADAEIPEYLMVVPAAPVEQSTEQNPVSA